MLRHQPQDLSPRERQVMDALYRLRRATVAQLVETVADDVSYSAVRAVLRTLRQKGHVAFREKGPRYVYHPSVSFDRARKRALTHVVRTYFDGSPEAAIVALCEMCGAGLSPGQRRALEEAAARTITREGGRQASTGGRKPTHPRRLNQDAALPGEVRTGRAH